MIDFVLSMLNLGFHPIHAVGCYKLDVYFKIKEHIVTKLFLELKNLLACWFCIVSVIVYFYLGLTLAILTVL